MMKRYIVSLLFSIFCYFHILHGAIYIPFNLENIETSNHQLAKQAQSIAAYIRPENVKYDASQKIYYVKKRKMGEAFNLCKDELFYERTSIASCTGFLISPRLLVTAGHCVPKVCDKEKPGFWWFGFTDENLQSLQQDEGYVKIKQEHLFRCEKHLDHYFKGDAFVDIEQNDYALILLQRAVGDSKPLFFRLEGKIGDNAKLVTIGHPSGMAKTISDNATVKLNVHKHYFSGDVDAIDGNSGSPVFNEDTGVVEGIVARTCTGKTSYFIDRNEENQCRRLNMDKYYYGGTDIIRITSIPNASKWVEIYK